MEIVPARYWRFVVMRSPSHTGLSNTVQIATLRFTDASEVPLTHQAVTNSGALTPYSGSVSLLADGDTATYMTIYRPTTNIFYGDIAVTYDFGSNVAPGGFLLRLTSVQESFPDYGMYTPASFDKTQVYVLSSSDNVTFNHVGYYPAVYGTSPNVNSWVNLDNVMPNYYTPTAPRPLSGDGGIYGIVSEDGVPASRPVFLYERDFFTPWKRTISNEYGGYSFQGLNRDRQWLVLAVDSHEESPGSGTYKNALVRDRITPVLATGLPSDGSAPEFFRYRAWKIRPSATFTFWAPEPVHRNRAGTPSHTSGALGSFVNLGGGGGWDLRALPLPAHLTPWLRMAYPRRGPLTIGSSAGNCPGPAGGSVTVELVIEVPSGEDPNALFVCFGTRTPDARTASQRMAAGIILEATATGVLNVRAPFNASNSFATRVSGSAAPGSVAHILICYTENTHMRLYVNGALANTASLSGLGTLTNAPVNAETPPSSWLTSNAVLATSNDTDQNLYGGGLWSLSRFCFGAGYPFRAGSSLAPMSGVAWVAYYPGDVSSTPDAEGTPIGVRDLYETYANDSVWVAGTRPPGWSVLPPYTGYGLEVVADAPMYWWRLQDTSSSAMVVGEGTHGVSGSGYFTASGVDYALPGMTAGMNAIRFGPTGALRIYGTSAPELGVRSLVTGGLCFGSIEAWYKPETLPTGADVSTIITSARTDNASGRLGLFVTSAGAIQFRTTDPSGTLYTHVFPAGTLVAGTAYHIVVTWDCIVDQKLCLYLNGVEVSSSAFLTQPPPETWQAAGFTIGNYDNWIVPTSPYNTSTVASSSSWARGLLQDVAVYSYALSPERVAAHYAARDS